MVVDSYKLLQLRVARILFCEQIVSVNRSLLNRSAYFLFFSLGNVGAKLLTELIIR